MIEIQELTNSHPLRGGVAIDVLLSITLKVCDRCNTAVVGLSGPGKTTLSKSISKLDGPIAGLNRVDGEPLDD